jgi:hypothetical protein
MANKYKFTFTRPPNLDPLWSSSSSLGQKIETMFLRFLQRLLHWGYEFIAELTVDIFDASMKIMRPGVAKATDPIIQKMLGDESIPPFIKAALQTALTEEGESSWLMKFIIFYVTIITGVTGSIDPVRRIVGYRADTEFRSFLPNITELAQLNRIGLVTDAKYDEIAEKLGLADPLKPVYKELVRNLPAMGELMAGLWRGVYSEGDFKAQVKRMGYDSKDSDLFLELTNNIPALQDLIRMLVRDAFNDSAANTYGYDEDFPTEINEFFKKQGYAPDWAKRYWRAHWNLPSPQQAYEMLHRGKIDRATMETLLRISDYPKFWRDKLADISYNVYTRVDIRRMFQAGVLDEGQVLAAYKEAGYDDEKARNLTAFAVKGSSEKEKDLTRSDILNLYEDNLIDRGEAEQGLVKMGYDSQEAGQYMDMADYNIAKSMRADEVRYVQEKYLAGKIADNEVMSSLTALGLTTNQIDRYVLQWSRSLESKVTLPSKADAVKFYKLDLIDETKFRDMLTELGYRIADIDLYVLANLAATTPPATTGGSNELPA